ncbi:MAG: MarR family transcriptional regulator [Bacteroidetes bacterium]|nr:MAG: MarR family transcriptional regulator [Bacteroidota bacterium]
MSKNEFPTIGEEIKQRKFRSEVQKAILNILVTSNKLYASNNRFLKQFGLSQEQYNVLRILRGLHPDPSTVLNIQERMMDKMSNASRLVDKLEAKKLLTRTQCASDRRQVEIVITQEGLDLLKMIDEPISSLEKKLSDLPEKDLIRVNEVLDQIRYFAQEEEL